MSILRLSISCAFTFIFVFSVAVCVDAATLNLYPNTGVYTVGKTFTITALLNTEGKSVNAADGQISFNPKELYVVSVSRASSIFNLWTEEPTFSNTAGTISFGGGSPTGYKGSGGGIITVTFKPLGAGTPKVNFKSGSVLAADGLGTNVLTSMNGGTYTVVAQTESPAPEYVPPANTPKAPVVTSETHPNQELWYTEKKAKLSWSVPSDVTAIRTLLDDEAGTIPTIVYDEKITTKIIEDLAEGVSYFHIQFKNKEGWGRVTHYRLAVDSQAPTGFTVTEEQDSDVTESMAVLIFTLEDTSPIVQYKIQIDGKEPFIYKDETHTKKYTLETLPPGYHTIIVEAFDSAGNSTVSTYSFTVEAFEKPAFTDYPSRINTEVIPAIKGTTRPYAKVAISVQRASDGILVQRIADDSDPYALVSDAHGEFTYVPNSTFEPGVYIFTATAKDTLGRLSEPSDPIRIIVEKPGYIVFGSMVVNALSVIIPLIALALLLVFGLWYLWHRLVRWRRKVRKETSEAEDSLRVEFNTIVKNLNTKVIALKESRKGKLTKAEAELVTQIETDLKIARGKISKEIEDIEDIVT